MEPKKFVFNNSGYSLLDALMGLFVMGFILFLLGVFITILNDNYHTNKELKELNLFVIQIQEDIIESKKTTVTNDKITFKTYLNDQITYTVEEDKLIREINNKGYEIMLNDLDEFEFTTKGNQIIITIKFKNDQREYQEVLTSEIAEEK